MTRDEPADIIERLRSGLTLQIHGRAYGLCARCQKIVRLDKPLVGALHVCAIDEADAQAMQF